MMNHCRILKFNEGNLKEAVSSRELGKSDLAAGKAKIFIEH
jgi:hypothetical protein